MVSFLLQCCFFQEWEGLNFKEIMAEVDAIKAAGNRLFKEGKFELAKTKYDKVLRDFKHVNPHGDEEAQELQTTNVSFVDFLLSLLLILSIL
jgi:hypothetical protein